MYMLVCSHHLIDFKTTNKFLWAFLYQPTGKQVILKTLQEQVVENIPFSCDNLYYDNLNCHF